MPLTASAYATTADLVGYLQAANTGDNAAIFTQLVTVVSRALDRKTGTYFYAAGTDTRYFNGDGTRRMDTGQHPFYSLTALKQAQFENQPTANWITVSGDGATPGSTNFWFWPPNPPLIGSTSSNTATRPYYGIDLAIIPQPNTTFLPSFVPGYRTISITANWGWPVVPDDIKNITLKASARMWNQYQSSWATQRGNADIGVLDISKYLDPLDLDLLRDYSIWSQGAA